MQPLMPAAQHLDTAELAAWIVARDHSHLEQIQPSSAVATSSGSVVVGSHAEPPGPLTVVVTEHVGLDAGSHFWPFEDIRGAVVQVPGLLPPEEERAARDQLLELRPYASHPNVATAIAAATDATRVVDASITLDLAAGPVVVLLDGVRLFQVAGLHASLWLACQGRAEVAWGPSDVAADPWPEPTTEWLDAGGRWEDAENHPLPWLGDTPPLPSPWIGGEPDPLAQEDAVAYREHLLARLAGDPPPAVLRSRDTSGAGSSGGLLGRLFGRRGGTADEEPLVRIDDAGVRLRGTTYTWAMITSLSLVLRLDLPYEHTARFIAGLRREVSGADDAFVADVLAHGIDPASPVVADLRLETSDGTRAESLGTLLHFRLLDLYRAAVAGAGPHGVPVQWEVPPHIGNR